MTRRVCRRWVAVVAALCVWGAAEAARADILQPKLDDAASTPPAATAADLPDPAGIEAPPSGAPDEVHPPEAAEVPPPVEAPRRLRPGTVLPPLHPSASTFDKDAVRAAPGDGSKLTLDARIADTDKVTQAPKVKACCGFPIAEREGFRLTFYWLAYEQDYAAEKYDTAIYTREGFFLGKYPSAFVYETTLEGTGVLLDGRVINYAGKCEFGTGTCFKTLTPSEHPLGTGVQGRALVPFRSIAVDPHRIPIGAPVYVPELVGLELPDGSHHDGCLRADDMGGAIKFGKMDFFVESMQNFKFLADNLWWRLKATPHLGEPRCEYLRVGTDRERQNEHVDWALLHKPKNRAADKKALAQLNRNRALAKAWVKRHTGAGGVLASGPSHKPGAALARSMRPGKR